MLVIHTLAARGTTLLAAAAMSAGLLVASSATAAPTVRHGAYPMCTKARTDECREPRRIAYQVQSRDAVAALHVGENAS